MRVLDVGCGVGGPAREIARFAGVKIVGVKDFKDRFTVPTHDLDSVTIDGEVNNEDVLKGNDLLTVRSNGNVELIGRTMVTAECPGEILFSGFTILPITIDLSSRASIHMF